MAWGWDLDFAVDYEAHEGKLTAEPSGWNHFRFNLPSGGRQMATEQLFTFWMMTTPSSVAGTFAEFGEL
jgi:hypothetical protein